MKKLFTALAVVLGMSSMAQAGMLVEPYLGYATGSVKATYNATNAALLGTSNADATISGMEYGLRLGYQFLLPWVALDYTGGSGTYKPDAAGFSSNDTTTSALGVTAGVSLPMIRPYVGYGFDNKITSKPSSGSSTDIKGTYIKAGIGLGFIPFVELNLEYKMHDFKKMDDNDISGAYDDFKASNFAILISKPFNL